MKILLPVDGSIYTKRSLAYLAAHDEVLGTGHEYLVFTVTAAVPPHAARFLDRSALEEYYRSEAENVLTPVCAYAAQKGWQFRSAHAAGHAAEAIAALAEAEGVDLIVMGSHGHSALGNVVLGSVASGVLARTRVPVLLIR
jgi:nucleotide-binding universal stress UspA family protein